MIAVAMIMFFALVVAWMVAPSGGHAPAPAPQRQTDTSSNLQPEPASS